jgi:hypothetical protein
MNWCDGEKTEDLYFDLINGEILQITWLIMHMIHLESTCDLVLDDYNLQKPNVIQNIFQKRRNPGKKIVGVIFLIILLSLFES